MKASRVSGSSALLDKPSKLASSKLLAPRRIRILGRHFWSDSLRTFSPGELKQHCSLLGSIVQTLRDVLDHPLGVLVKQGVVLDDDQGVTGLFKNGHELKDCEGSADLQVLEFAVQSAQD